MYFSRQRKKSTELTGAEVINPMTIISRTERPFLADWSVDKRVSTDRDRSDREASYGTCTQKMDPWWKLETLKVATTKMIAQSSSHQGDISEKIDKSQFQRGFQKTESALNASNQSARFLTVLLVGAGVRRSAPKQ